MSATIQIATAKLKEDNQGKALSGTASHAKTLNLTTDTDAAAGTATAAASLTAEHPSVVTSKRSVKNTGRATKAFDKLLKKNSKQYGPTAVNMIENRNNPNKTYEDFVRYIESSFVDANWISEDHKNMSLLMLACRANRLDIINYLLASNANPALIDINGRNALMHFVKHVDDTKKNNVAYKAEYLKILDRFIEFTKENEASEKKFNINQMTPSKADKVTALSLAKKYAKGFEEILEKLMAAGAVDQTKNTMQNVAGGTEATTSSSIQRKSTEEETTMKKSKEKSNMTAATASAAAASTAAAVDANGTSASTSASTSTSTSTENITMKAASANNSNKSSTEKIATESPRNQMKKEGGSDPFKLHNVAALYLQQLKSYLSFKGRAARKLKITIGGDKDPLDINLKDGNGRTALHSIIVAVNQKKSQHDLNGLIANLKLLALKIHGDGIRKEREDSQRPFIDPYLNQVNLNAQDKDGNTILHLAVVAACGINDKNSIFRKTYVEMIQLLSPVLDHDVANLYQETAFQIASRNQADDIMALFPDKAKLHKASSSATAAGAGTETGIGVGGATAAVPETNNTAASAMLRDESIHPEPSAGQASSTLDSNSTTTASATASSSSDSAKPSITPEVGIMDLDSISLEELIARAKKKENDEATEASTQAEMQKEIEALNAAVAAEEKLKNDAAAELKRVQDQLKEDLKAKLRAPKKQFPPIDFTATKSAIHAKKVAAATERARLEAQTQALLASFKPMTFSAAAAEAASVGAATASNRAASTGLPSTLDTAESPISTIPIRTPSPQDGTLALASSPTPSSLVQSLLDAGSATAAAATTAAATVASSQFLSPAPRLPSPTQAILSNSPPRSFSMEFSDLYTSPHRRLAASGGTSLTLYAANGHSRKRLRNDLPTAAITSTLNAVAGTGAGTVAETAAAPVPAAARTAVGTPTLAMGGAGTETTALVNPSPLKKHKH